MSNYRSVWDDFDPSIGYAEEPITVKPSTNEIFALGGSRHGQILENPRNRSELIVHTNENGKKTAEIYYRVRYILNNEKLVEVMAAADIINSPLLAKSLQTHGFARF